MYRNGEVEVNTITIQDLATLSVHDCHSNSSLSMEAMPMDVYLFCVRQGQICLHASFIPHPLELTSGDAIFLAFPKSDWHVKIVYPTDTIFYTCKMSVGSLHKILQPSFDEKQLENAPQVHMKDLMKLIPVSMPVMLCFDQLFHHKLQPPLRAVFEHGKFLEIFSLILDAAFGKQADSCPVMLSHAIENKIHQVRRHIMENVDEVPDPDTLALQYDIPRQTLKEGYRYIYGKTIHQFHADHKLESAMQMLSSGELLVKEVAFRIGYQNPSHFIAAFKKKFGLTPKQFLKS